MIHVTVFSPNPALRVGLRELLGEAPQISVLNEAVNLDTLDEETEVLVLASVLPSDFQEIAPGMPAILLLSDDLMDVQQLVEADVPVWGVLSPNASEDELIAAVHALGEGLWVGAPGLVRSLLRKPNRVELVGGEELIEPLTARETEVLQWVAQGLANKQVALALSISEHTVKFHLSSLYAKLGAASRTEAIREGIQRGLIVI